MTNNNPSGVKRRESTVPESHQTVNFVNVLLHQASSKLRDSLTTAINEPEAFCTEQCTTPLLFFTTSNSHKCMKPPTKDSGFMYETIFFICVYVRGITKSKEKVEIAKRSSV